MAVIMNGNEIVLSGTVGEMFFEDGFSASDVIVALAQIGGNQEARIRLNSGGGIATEGAAIHSALKAHKGGVHIVVEGIAASAASLIAMAGKTITMQPGAIMMIHDPAGVTMGDAAAHQKSIEALNALGDAYASVYADRTGKPAEDMRAIMRAETWLTASQAIEQGFADAMGADNDNAVEPSAFNYQTYAHAPQRFVALANARGWKARAALAAQPAAPHPHHKDNPMTDETKAGETLAIEIDEEAIQEVIDAKVDGLVKEVEARNAEIVDICATAGVSHMASSLIREGLSVEKARERANAAGEIHNLVARTAKSFPAVKAAMADEFISQGLSVTDAHAALLEKILANQSPEVSPHVAVSDTKPAGAAWDKQIARVNARNPAA